MNTQELIEHTVLYALGLLEEPEQNAYESALMAAAPGVRAAVRAEAARMADLGDLLPDEQPGPEVRDMVLAAVRAGMRERENEQRLTARLSGLAGTPKDANARPTTHTAAHTAGRITPERRHAQPALARAGRVHWAWRAAAIGLAGATIALTVLSADLRNIQDSANDGARLAHLYGDTGPEFVNSVLFDPNTRHVTLTPAAADTSAVASVWHNPDWSSARLFVKNLRPQADDAPYRLVVLDAEGNIVREVTEIRPNGEVQDFSITVNLTTESRLAIYQGIQDSIEAQPLLRSTGSDL